ncbi:hypothetical protein RF11_15632 [Thelohanellus kitauei]|uniref:Uncharacterized protein n=1 Tax=Thelohanellus kitauei TaxID=669202 RepID=A0A0C2MSA6_THEKT|nr:hypothetical protein RF11_15632 [Thelohanellus kitauei]
MPKLCIKQQKKFTTPNGGTLAISNVSEPNEISESSITIIIYYRIYYVDDLYSLLIHLVSTVGLSNLRNWDLYLLGRVSTGTNNGEDIRQSSIMPTFFEDDILDQYLFSDSQGTYSKVSLIFSAPIVSSINQEEPDVNALIVSRKTSVIRELTSAVQNLSLKSAMNVDSEGMRHTNVWDY